MTDITGWKVILVDDEPDSLDLIHDILTLNGAQVYRATGGQQGLSLLAEVVPTLVVLDLAMPRPNGWDLLRAIRAMPQTTDVPVVAVTAYYSDSVIRQASEAGFDAFFPKPIRSSMFLSKLKELAG